MEIQAGHAGWQGCVHAPGGDGSVPAAVVGSPQTKPKLHREHHAELRVAAIHAFVSFSSFFQREFFDHGANASKSGEAHGVFRIGGGARSPTLQAPFAEQKHEGRDFDVARSSADDDHRTVAAESGEEIGHRFRIRRSGEDHFCAAQFLQFRGGIGVLTIDVNVRAEFPGKVAVFGATSNGRDTIAKFVGPLDAEMAEAADALYGDEIAWARPAMAQSIKRCNTGAEKRTGFRWIQAVGDRGESFGRSEHVLLVAAVEVDPGDSFILAGDEIAFAAGGASKIVAAVPSDSGALAFLPIGDARAGFVDDAGNLVAGNARVLDAGENAIFGEMVAETDAASLDLDTHLSGAGLGDFTFDKFEIAASFGDLDCLHFWHEKSAFRMDGVAAIGCSSRGARYQESAWDGFRRRESAARGKRKSFQMVIGGGLRGGGIASYTAFPAKWQARRVGSPPNSTV